ncbi:hypothetical protein Goarm_000552, partial [Gossypium armourianum]|nr:hypothetical protein [Gossypium armourianum]
VTQWGLDLGFLEVEIKGDALFVIKNTLQKRRIDWRKVHTLGVPDSYAQATGDVFSDMHREKQI